MYDRFSRDKAQIKYAVLRGSNGCGCSSLRLSNVLDEFFCFDLTVKIKLWKSVIF